MPCRYRLINGIELCDIFSDFDFFVSLWQQRASKACRGSSPCRRTDRGVSRCRSASPALPHQAAATGSPRASRTSSGVSWRGRTWRRWRGVCGGVWRGTRRGSTCTGRPRRRRRSWGSSTTSLRRSRCAGCRCR